MFIFYIFSLRFLYCIFVCLLVCMLVVLHFRLFVSLLDCLNVCLFAWLNAYVCFLAYLFHCLFLLTEIIWRTESLLEKQKSNINCKDEVNGNKQLSKLFTGWSRNKRRLQRYNILLRASGQFHYFQAKCGTTVCTAFQKVTGNKISPPLSSLSFIASQEAAFIWILVLGEGGRRGSSGTRPQTNSQTNKCLWQWRTFGEAFIDLHQTTIH